MPCDAMRKGLNEARTRFILRIAKTNIFINAKLLYFAVSFIIIFWGKLTLTYNWFFLHPRKPRDQFKTSVRIHSIYSGLPEVYVPHLHFYTQPTPTAIRNIEKGRKINLTTKCIEVEKEAALTRVEINRHYEIYKIRLKIQ